MFTDEFLKRFNARVDKSPHVRGCWTWKGYIAKSGYGNVWHKKNALAHRIAYEIAHNCEVPSEINVCHSCDNPRCVNPDHLWLGTDQDNMDDKMLKNRHPVGEKCVQSVFTESEVIAIRQEYSEGVTYQQLAEKYKSKYQTIYCIVRRTNWKWLD